MDPVGAERPAVALLHWGSVIEDFLDPLGVDLESFRTEMTGGWMFGYLVALHAVGLEPFLVCISRSVSSAETVRHEPTGITMEVLPPTRAFRVARVLLRPLLDRRVRAAEAVTEYLATPPLRLLRVLRRRRCRVVLCQEYESPRFDVTVVLARLTRRRAYATFQGGTRTRPGRWGRHVERRIRAVTIRHADGLVIASAAEIARVRSAYGVPAAKIAHVPNPIDVGPTVAREDARRTVGLPAHAGIVAWHGRVEIRRKGLDVLLDAWQLVRDASPAAELRLVLLGSGSDAEALRCRLHDLGGDDIVWVDEYVHDRDRIRALLASADVYAFTSPHEGFAVAPAEAMALGVPVVATGAPGIVDLLPDGEDSGGIVVPIGDGVRLAAELGALLADPARARRLGELARRRVERDLSTEAVGTALRSFIVDGSRPS